MISARLNRHRGNIDGILKTVSGIVLVLGGGMRVAQALCRPCLSWTQNMRQKLPLYRRRQWLPSCRGDWEGGGNDEDVKFLSSLYIVFIFYLIKHFAKTALSGSPLANRSSVLIFQLTPFLFTRVSIFPDFFGGLPLGLQTLSRLCLALLTVPSCSIFSR